MFLFHLRLTLPYRTSRKSKDGKIKRIKTKECSRNGCFFCLFFPFAFRIVKQRNPSNPPAGRTPEPFRLKAKKARQWVKGQKSPLTHLPMRVFRSPCQRGKIIPFVE